MLSQNAVSSFKSMFPPPPARSSSEQSGRKQTPAKAEVGRKANNAAEHTAILSFMCSIFLLIFFISLLPRRARLSEQLSTMCQSLRVALFFIWATKCPEWLIKILSLLSFKALVPSLFAKREMEGVRSRHTLKHGADNLPCRSFSGLTRESISQPARCLFLYGLPDRSPAMTLLLLYHKKVLMSSICE